MQISTKENGNLVRVNGGSSFPGFELTGLYCIYCMDVISFEFLKLYLECTNLDSRQIFITRESLFLL